MIRLEEYQSGHIEKGVGGYSYFVLSFVNDEWKWDNPASMGC